MKSRNMAYRVGAVYRTTAEIDLRPYGVVPCGTRLRVVDYLPDWQAVSVDFLQTPAGFPEDGFALQGDECKSLEPEFKLSSFVASHRVAVCAVLLTLTVGWMIPPPSKLYAAACDTAALVEATIASFVQ